MARGQSPFQGRYTVPKVDFSPIERAGGAYGKAIESMGLNVSAGIQKYQRNKQEAMTLAGRIEGEMQHDPEMVKYLAGDPKHAKTLNNLTEGKFSLTEMQALYGTMSGYENSRKNKHERAVRQYQRDKMESEANYQRDVKRELAETEQAVGGLATQQNAVERAKDINFLLGRPQDDNTWVLGEGITDFTKPLPAMDPEKIKGLMSDRHRYLISQARIIKSGGHKPISNIDMEAKLRENRMAKMREASALRGEELEKLQFDTVRSDAIESLLRKQEDEELTLEGKKLSNERMRQLLQGGGLQDPSHPGPSRSGTGTRGGGGGTTSTTTQGRVGKLNKEIADLDKAQYEWTYVHKDGATGTKTGTISEFKDMQNTYEEGSDTPTFTLRPSEGLSDALAQRSSLMSERDQAAGKVRVGVSDYEGINLRPKGQSEKDTLKIQNDMVIALHKNHPTASVDGYDATGAGFGSAGLKRMRAEPSDFGSYQEFVDFWIKAGAHYREIPAPTQAQETNPIGGVSQTYAAEQWTNFHDAHARGPIIKTAEGGLVRVQSKEQRLGWVWQSKKQIQEANPDMHSQVVDVRHEIQRIQFNDNQTREQVEEVGIPFQVDVYGGQVDGGYTAAFGNEEEGEKFDTGIYIPMRVSMPHPDKDIAGKHTREHNSKIPLSLAFKQWEYVPARGEDGVAQWKEIDPVNVITERDAQLAVKIIEYVTNSAQFQGANESKQRELMEELAIAIRGEFPAYYNEYGLGGHKKPESWYDKMAEQKMAEGKLSSPYTASLTPPEITPQQHLNNQATQFAKSGAYGEAEIRSLLERYAGVGGGDVNEAMTSIQPLLQQKAGVTTP